MRASAKSVDRTRRKRRRVQRLARCHSTRDENDGVIRHEVARALSGIGERYRVAILFNDRPAACKRLGLFASGLPDSHARERARKEHPQHGGRESKRNKP